MGRWGTYLLLFLTAGLAGCNYGWTHNPVSFGNFPLFGDVVRTHSKPAGEAYFRNYDRDAHRIEVVCQAPVAAVQSRQVILVSIVDCKGAPLTSRCVEWQLEGAGTILEVDESGLKPGRGYKVDNRFAVSYTDLFAHTLKKWNGHPNEDIPLKPGQTWCVVSSLTEGDTQLSIWAPEIANWDENRRVVTIRWVDAEWTLPPPQSAGRNSQPVLSTLVRRRTDRAPVNGYRVRYRILDGAPAVFVSSRGPEAEVTTDDRGAGTVALAPTAGQGGRTRIGIDIVRPADPRLPSGPVVVIGQGETAIDWEAAAISLEQVAPASVPIGQDMTLSLMVTNRGNVPTGPLVVRAPLPPGLSYVSSEPLALGPPQHKELVWQIPSVPAREQRALRAILRGAQVGPATSLVRLQGGEESLDRSATIQVLPPEVPKLVVKVVGPKQIMLRPETGEPVTINVVARNEGTGPTRPGVLHAKLDGPLQHESGKDKLDTPLDALSPGESRSFPLQLRPLKTGPARVSVWVVDGPAATDPSVHDMMITEPTLALRIVGPKTALLGQATTWQLEVKNLDTVPVANVLVQDRLPPGVELVRASGNALRQNGEISWVVGTLQPNEGQTFEVVGTPARLGDRLLHEARVTATPGGQATAVSANSEGVEVRARTEFAVTGLAALKIRVRDLVDPIAPGQPLTYQVEVRNEGSSPVARAQVTAVLPTQVKFVAARGPTLHQLTDRTLTFAPIEQLQPGQAITYFIDATAILAGEARLAVQLLGGGTREAIVQEESTNIR